MTASKESGSPIPEGTTDSSEGPRSVVTLGEPPDANAAPAAPNAATTASVSPAAVPTLALAVPDISLREKTEQLMRDVNGDAKQVDEKNLTPDQISRETLAKRLINSAQKSFDDNDYSAANSLATKASALLRSLPRIESSSTSK